MQNKKYVVGLIAIVVLGSLSWLSTEALNINSSSFQTGDPVFKQILFKLLGDKTNPSEVILDNNGVYISTNALPTNNGSVYKRLADGSMTVEQVVNQDIDSGSISTIKIMDGTITNANIANININNNNFENNTLVITKFDPTIVWPTGGNSYYTNNVCAGLTAITSITAGTATCTTLPPGNTGTNLPVCNNGDHLTYDTILGWECDNGGYGTTGTDYWDETQVPLGNIYNNNIGKVGIGTTGPTQQLHVSGSLDVQGTSEDQVYCYANDTWVDISVYNPAACAGCNPGFHYNATTQLCEQSSCVGTGPTLVNGQCGSANGGTFAIAPTANLCSAGTTGVVGGSGPWTWTCSGTGGGSNASCSANITTNNTCGGYAGPIYVRRTLINNQYTSQNSDPLCGGRPNGQYWDEWDCQYDFYSDPAGTIPVSVTNLIVETWGNGGAGSFIGNGFSTIQTSCQFETVEDFPPAGCGTYGSNQTIMTNSSCAEEIIGGGGGGGGGSGGINFYIRNRSNFGDLITDINTNGAQFFVINQGSYPIGGGSNLDAIHGGLGANDMDYNVSSAGMQCIYVFINNEADATAGSCNPSGYVSQTQIPAAVGNGTIIAPAFSSTDRVDLLMCSGICN